MTTDSQQNKTTKADEVSLREILIRLKNWSRYLWSKWLIIGLMGLVGGAIGFYYAMTKKPIYMATTTFVLEDEGSNSLGGFAGLASIAGMDLQGGGGIFQGENIFELYKSRKMVAQTLLTQVNIENKSQLLIERYIAFNKLTEKWAEQPKMANLKFNVILLPNGEPALPTNRLTDSVLNVIVADIIKNYLSVAKQDKKLSIVKVDVKAQDEPFAKLFNETIVKNVNDFYVQTKTKKALENVKILQQKTDSVRTVMNGAIYSAAAITDATPNLNPTRQAQRTAPVQRSQFSAETNKSILSSLVQNLEMAKISLRKEAPLIQVIDEPVYPLNKSKLSKILFFIIFSFLASVVTIVYLVMAKIYKAQMEPNEY